MKVKITRPPVCDTFDLPKRNELLALKNGDFVKLIFGKERMWVELIDCSSSDNWTGTLSNNSVLSDIKYGELIEFHPLDVIGWSRK